MNKKKIKNVIKKINQIRVDDDERPIGGRPLTTGKHQNQVGLTLTNKSIISRLEFSVDRKYVEQLRKLVIAYLPRQRRMKRHNLAWLFYASTNALEALPEFVSFYNISIPIFNLGNTTTDDFRDWENEWGSSNKVSGKKMKRIVKHCHKYINEALSVYSKPKNLFKLSLYANFILGISINPVRNKLLKKNKKALKPHTKKYNPKISVKFINEQINFKW